MRDFTQAAYRRLVAALARRYRMIPFHEFARRGDSEHVACLRHDVDRLAEGALPCATTCRELDVRATFYFRYPFTFERAVLKRVAELGHEVGYHYETLTKTDGDIPAALALFAAELAEFRAVTEVTTACMHGSPLSSWDNRDIWKAAGPQEFGLVSEPYLAMTEEDGYLTDTGRGWNRRSASLRDAMPGPMPAFESTDAVIDAIDADALPRRLMITVHPERWNDGLVSWTRELVGQTAKNQIKAILRRARHSAARR